MSNNWQDIDAAVKKAAKQKLNDKIDKCILGAEYNSALPPITEAGNKLIEVLNSEIHNSVLSPGQQAAIPEFKCGTPLKISTNKYAVNVSNGIRTSPSLEPERYGGIRDLTLLFNDGVDHIMNPVQGYWHGKEIWSRTKIPATHFLENSKDIFLNTYRSKYRISEVIYKLFN